VTVEVQVVRMAVDLGRENKQYFRPKASGTIRITPQAASGG